MVYVLWALLFIRLMTGQPGYAEERLVLDVASLEGKQDITPYGRVLLDTQNRAAQDIEKLFPKESQSFSELLHGGYRNGFYWVRLELANSSSQPKSSRLILNNRVVSHLEYFPLGLARPDDVTMKRAHDRIPNIQITLAPSTHVTLLLKLQFGLHDALTLSMEATQPDRTPERDTVAENLNIFTGIMIAMLLFNIVLYFLTHDIIFILHALSSAFVMGAIFLLNGLSYYLLETDYWNFLVPVFGNFAVAATNMFALYYFNPKLTHPRLYKSFITGIGVGVVGGTLLLLGATKQIIYITDLNLLILAVNGMSFVYYYSPRKHRMMRFYLIGWLGLALAALLWVGTEYGYIQRHFLGENALNFGLSFEMLVMSLGLADQINSFKNQLAEYNKGLELLVYEKTRDIRSIMEHIPLGVFMIKPDLTIHKDYSRHLNEIFQRQNIETVRATNLIFDRAAISRDDCSQAESCLFTALGGDVINFEINAHTLPLEIRRQLADGEERIYDLTWNAIENSQSLVDKVLVTMRDVTDIRKLQEQSKDQQEELEFIGEILRVPTPRFLRFIQSCRDLIQENDKLIRSQGAEKRNFEVLKLLFINMHTVKGAARSLYLKKMALVFHDIEQYYSHLQNNTSAVWDIAQMKRDLGEAQRVVDLYESIAKEKLGRSSEQTSVIEFHMEQIEGAYRDLRDALQGKTLPMDLAAAISQVQSLFHYKIFKESSEVFEDLIDCLRMLAKDLHKEVPKVTMDTHGILLSDEAEDLFRNIFVHLLRNAMDHGIESPEERIRQNKTPHGNLFINLERRDQTLMLTYSDDGRGLNISKIRDIGLARGLLDPSLQNDADKVAELIFDSGLSTANRVTEISGRGVGMDAMRRFIQQHDGDIRIVLHHEKKTGNNFYPFTMVITLPFSLFEEAQPSQSMRAV